jgi:hypothetical protein
MRMIRLAIPIFVFAVTMLAGRVSAQQSSDPPAAPVPSPIFTARTLFISNASGEILLPTGTPDLTYNEFYAAMKNWGRYEIVSNPADANLVFEIRFMNSGTDQNFQFRAVVLEPKSHVILWAFSENVRQSGNAKTGRKYFDDAMAALVADLTNLAKQPSAAVSKLQN